MFDEDEVDITKTIVGACKQFEATWETLINLIDELDNKTIVHFALRRLMSYDPQNKIIEQKNPALAEGINCITQVLVKQIELIQTNNAVFDYWRLLSLCYLVLDDISNAYTAYAVSTRLGSENRDPYMWYEAGCCFQIMGYPARAEEAFQHAYLNLNSAPDGLQREVVFRLALAARDMKDYPTSLRHFNSSQTKPPYGLTEDDIYFQTCYTTYLSSFQEAQTKYQTLFNRNQNNYAVLHDYLLFLSLSDDETILNHASKVIDSLPDKTKLLPQIQFMTARIAMKTNDLPKAYNYYKSCFGDFQADGLYWFGLADLYNHNNQQADATKAYQRALVCCPKMVEAWLNLGMMFEQTDIKTAERIYTTGHQNCPRDKTLLARLGSLPRISSCVVSVDEKKYVTFEAQQQIEQYKPIITQLDLSVICADADSLPKLDIMKQSHHSFFSNPITIPS